MKRVKGGSLKQKGRTMKMTFGKYEGLEIKEIYQIEKSYLYWIMANAKYVSIPVKAEICELLNLPFDYIQELRRKILLQKDTIDELVQERDKLQDEVDMLSKETINETDLMTMQRLYETKYKDDPEKMSAARLMYYRLLFILKEKQNQPGNAPG
jgi:uncharacterized protein (DUF3820 family)